MSKPGIRKIVNICIVIAVVCTWITMALFGKGSLADNGFRSLKYFTVQSNLLEGLASVIWLRASRKGSAGEGAERLKYIAAAAVGLTFTTVMVFLGPLYGYGAMLSGINLFFHLLIPVASMLEIILLSDMDYTRRDNNFTLIPTVIYGIFYVGNILINGIGEWPDTNDWYLFLTWGYLIGVLILACICLVTWLIAFIMRKLQAGIRS